METRVSAQQEDFSSVLSLKGEPTITILPQPRPEFAALVLVLTGPDGTVMVKLSWQDLKQIFLTAVEAGFVLADMVGLFSRKPPRPGTPDHAV